MSANVKMEDAPDIKPEPATAVPTNVMDEDPYEDTGELRMDKTMQEAGAWLAKVPKWLWEAWEEMDDDEEIELGQVRVYDRRPEDPPLSLIHI